MSVALRNAPKDVPFSHPPADWHDGEEKDTGWEGKQVRIPPSIIPECYNLKARLLCTSLSLGFLTCKMGG